MKIKFKKFFLTGVILFLGMISFPVFAQQITKPVTKPVTKPDVKKESKKKDPDKKKTQGQGSTSVNSLNEIKLIPCTRDLVDRVEIIRNIIRASSAFKVKSFTEESNTVPQKATDRLPYTITIRYFHPNDEAKAKRLKTLLAAQGFDNSTLGIESMMQAIGGTIPNYIEIWTKW